MKKILVVLLTVLFIVGCGSSNDDKQEVYKVGLMGSDSLVWKHVAAELAKEDIKLEIIAFSDYPQVNDALHQKEIDLNAFQHQAYLDKENEELGYDIVAIGKTYIAPLGIYSKDLTDVNQVKENDKVAIPNDVTNGGRALQLLESANLIKLKADVEIPSLKDIEDNPLNLEIIEMAAANIPSSLADVAIAAINSGIAVDAGFVPEDDSLVFEEFDLDSDNPYINIIAVNSEDKDLEIFKKILEIYYTDEVKELVKEDSNGGQIPVW